jgi:hypothetical protein
VERPGFPGRFFCAPQIQILRLAFVCAGVRRRGSAGFCGGTIAASGGASSSLWRSGLCDFRRLSGLCRFRRVLWKFDVAFLRLIRFRLLRMLAL